MFEIFMVVINIALVGVTGLNIYWQAQIDMRARYTYFQMLFGVLVAFWIADAQFSSWNYVVFVALFVLLNIMSGIAGITPTRLVSAGIFQRLFKYTDMTAVTLTPIATPNGKNFIIAVFVIGGRRYVRMTFTQPLEALVTLLRQRLPEAVPVSIQKIN